MFWEFQSYLIFVGSAIVTSAYEKTMDFSNFRKLSSCLKSVA